MTDSRLAAGRPRPRGRVLVAKPGLDGHSVGAKVVTRALRDAGFEVIYTGLRQEPAMIATAALQEDVQLVGLSILSGAHPQLVGDVVAEMRKRGLADVPVFVGGVIPEEDWEDLRAAGAAEVFGPGTSLEVIVERCAEQVARVQAGEAGDGDRGTPDASGEKGA